MPKRDDVGYWCVIALVVFALFMLAMSKASRADEQQIRRDCRRDAVRYCTAEAARCAVAETAQCRADIIRCMVANRDKLQAKCIRHIH